MAKKSKSKSAAASKRPSESVYSHLGPTNSRTLGSTRNHDHCTIPSSTFRTLDQTISRSQMRTESRYDWNPKTGKSKITEEPVDLMDHARRSITAGRFHSVTSGIRQRYNREEDKRDRRDRHSEMCYPTAPSSPLGGQLGSKRKERY